MNARMNFHLEFRIFVINVFDIFLFFILPNFDTSYEHYTTRKNAARLNRLGGISGSARLRKIYLFVVL